MTRQHYAHSLRGRPLEEWHKLEEHLVETAKLADAFAASFAVGWGWLAGLWHDLGKYQRAFQERIGADPNAHTEISVDHSSVGALLAIERKASPLAFVIAGHHGGLSNLEDLRTRLAAKKALLQKARAEGVPEWIADGDVPPLPSRLFADAASLSFWIRLLFSALVDADFLDTERFYAGGRERKLGVRPTLGELKLRLDTHIAKKMAEVAGTAVNEMRARVLRACREAALLEPGVFTLTVPTGGGKTLSSLAFALEHAVKNELSRVIVVIPFTSIIEQTAGEYREALGDEAVLEHHVNVDPEKETQANRLASENWDAPVVVTTSVQFFESLYANTPSRCRKLHRIARSVVVFDEVQTFPVRLLAAVKHALRQLAEHYSVTTLLCTATQPVLLDQGREIVPNPEREFAVVAGRYNVFMPRSEAPANWEQLAEELRRHNQVMAIVHRRDDAQRLAELVGHECLHLSGRMCAAHRSMVLSEVKRRLRAKEPCALVATQLVEAGVDIDFPVLYRAFAGVDSLAQASGRCNREGTGQGEVHIFIAPTKPPSGILRTAEEVARTMWHEGALDLNSPATFRDYFARLYQMAEQDASGIMAAEREQRLAEVAARFRMIDDVGEPVVAPYAESEHRVDEVRRGGLSRENMRRLQPFLVNLYPQEIQTLAQAGAIERIHDAFWVVVSHFRVYDQRWGFGWRGRVAAEPEGLIA